jgi:predicted membrane channel-forming protein YqfA (hemolysin III family)
LAVGWIAVLAMPRLFVRLGVASGLLIVTGGLVYWLFAAECGHGVRPPAMRSMRSL